MPHGQEPQNEPEVGVRLPEKFDEETKDPVEKQEQGDHHAVRKSPFPEHPEKYKKNRPFHEGLVQLGRMAGKGAGAGKDHGPRHIRGPPVELAVNEVADSSQAQADGRCDHGAVRHGPKGHFVSSREQPAGKDTAYKPAVKGQAPLPHRNDFEGPAEKIRQVMVLVKENLLNLCLKLQLPVELMG